MSVRSTDLAEKWYEYVYRDRAEAVGRFVEAFPERRALSVSCERVGHDYRFLRPLLAEPDEVLRAGKEALGRFEAGGRDREFGDAYLRVGDLPAESDLELGELGADHLNRLHTIPGVVEATGPVSPKVVRAGYRCGKCEAVTRHVSQSGRTRREHAKCPRCNSVGYLSIAPADSDYVDAQLVTVRSPTAPDRSVEVLLEHDLVGTVSQGDDVRVVGIPRAHPAEGSTIADVWVESVSMERLTDDTR